MISVVIPLYNKAQSIGRTVMSVLDQTYENFELLIVNDGSTDQSLEVVQRIQDMRIKIINKENGGVSSARNIGMEYAHYEYIAFLDGDDLWLPHHLQEIVNLIEIYDNATVGGFVTSFKRIHTICERFVGASAVGKSYIVDDYYLHSSTPSDIISSSNFVVKKSLLNNCQYNVNLKYGEDVDFWYRYFRHKKLVKSDQVTAYYLLSTENRSVANVVGLEHRFWDYNFIGKSLSEKKYLGKLVAILLIDYIQKGRWAEVGSILMKYYKNGYYVFRYFVLLVKKRMFKNEKNPIFN